LSSVREKDSAKKRWSAFVALSAAVPGAMFAACGGTTGADPGDAAAEGASDRSVFDRTVVHRDGSFGGPFCDLPGSVVFQSSGVMTVVAGGPPNTPDLTWLTLPAGFCAHYFAHVNVARQIRFAPGGELFVASPTTFTTGGGYDGLAEIVVLADDNLDGYADGDALPHPDQSAQNLSVFLSGLASTQGILFAPGFFYYQDHTRIMRLPYQAGDRTPESSGTQVADITIYSSYGHWPKSMDIADDGTIFVGNGGDQGESCDPAAFPRPFHGGILKLDGSPGGTPVAQGFRNPIAVKCQHGTNRCFASELALDGSSFEGGREKLVPIRQGDDWGYPCCATANVPYSGASSANCSSVAPDNVSFIIGNTPFGFDFEPGLWPAPYTNSILLALHGGFVTWTGARVVMIATDASGMPIPTSDLDSGSAPPPNFATGWDDASHKHGRPADVMFAPDGRMFLANDQTGDIVWFAPVGLNGPALPEGGLDAGDASDATNDGDVGETGEAGAGEGMDGE
jgi:glucose/arabinose dehydrogenase